MKTALSALAGALVFFLSAQYVGAEDGAATAAVPVPVTVLTSVAQDTGNRLILRGRTEANRRVAVPAQTTGQVVSEPLRRGAEVRAGQVLCRLDAGVRAAQLAEAKAALSEAEAEAAASRQLKTKGFAAEVTLRARLAQLEAAQARVDQVAWDIAKLQITAPFSGVLETDTAELGALMTPGSYCATLVNLDTVKVLGFVSEREVDKLAVGQSATARLINGVEAEGRITFISRSADEDTRTFAVEVTLPNPHGRLRDGMTTELEIALPSEQAHLLPQTALTLDDEGRLGVRVAEDGTARFYPVNLLRDTVGGAWVSGLPDRADVIVIGQEYVRDGRAVQPVAATTDLLQ